jgi:hypothetical protein
MPGLGRRTFNAGEVLTAANVQNYLQDQAVMNFAGTATRSSAIPSPSDGMVTYNQSNDQIEAYNGSAWIGVGGLQLIKTQVVGSAVSSVTVSNAFNATYDNYRIIWTGGNGSGADLRLTLGASVASYSGALIYNRPNTPAPAGISVSNGSFWQYGAGLSSSNGQHCSFEIYQPFVAARTTVFTKVMQISDATSAFGTFSGFHDVAASYSSFTITPSTGTITGGTIFVYGFSE